MDFGRVVEIRTQSGGGSGYLIAPDLVLTAWHVVAGEPDPAVGHFEIRVQSDYEDETNPARRNWLLADRIWPSIPPLPGMDAALLKVTAGSARLERDAVLAPAIYPVTTSSQITVQATGYPDFAMFQTERGDERDTCRINGGFDPVNLRKQIDAGSAFWKLKLAPEEQRDDIVDWQGLSGAALFTYFNKGLRENDSFELEQLMGVVVYVHSDAKTNEFDVVPIHRLMKNTEFRHLSGLEYTINIPRRINAHLYRLDRGTAADDISRYVRQFADRRKKGLREPLFLVERGTRKHEFDTWFARLRRDLPLHQRDLPGVQSKPINWPREPFDHLDGLHILKTNLQTAIPGLQFEVLNGPDRLDPAPMRELLSSTKRSLVTCTVVSSDQLNEVDIALLSSWDEFWKAASPPEVPVICIMAFLDESFDPDEEGLRKEVPRPQGVPVNWNCLRPLRRIEEEDGRKWIQELEEPPMHLQVPAKLRVRILKKLQMKKRYMREVRDNIELLVEVSK